MWLPLDLEYAYIDKNQLSEWDIKIKLNIKNENKNVVLLFELNVKTSIWKLLTLCSIHILHIRNISSY